MAVSKKESQARWYRKNSAKHKANVKARTVVYHRDMYERLRAYLLDHPCVDCNKKDPIVLEFDHVQGDKRDSVSRLITVARVSWQTLLAEIEKCEVRCANCHRRVTAKRGNWIMHQLQEEQ